MTSRDYALTLAQLECALYSVLGNCIEADSLNIFSVANPALYHYNSFRANSKALQRGLKI